MRNSFVFLLAIFFSITSIILQDAHADRERLNRFSTLVTSGFQFDQNDTYIQILDQSGNYHDVLKVDAGGNTEINAPAAEDVEIYYNGTSLITSFDQNGLTMGSFSIRGTDGTAASPSYTFSSDPDTGLYSAGADNLALTVGGVFALQVFEAASVTQVAVQGNGSASAPNITWSGDTDTGLYRSAANEVSISSNGSNVATFDSGGLDMGATQDVKAFSFIVDGGNQGLYNDDTTDTIVIAGGTSSSINTGANIYLRGDSQATVGGDVDLNAGDNAGSSVDVNVNNSEVASFDSNGLTMGATGQIVFQESDSEIRSNADTKRFLISGGSAANNTNGAIIDIRGDDFGGTDAGGGVFITSGNNSAGSDVSLNAWDQVIVQNQSSTVATFDSGGLTMGANTDITFGGGTSVISMDPSVTTGILHLAGGYQESYIDGGYISVEGDDFGGANLGGAIVYNAGKNASSNHEFLVNNTTVATFDSGGLDVAGNLYMTTNNSYLQMKDESGNAHDVLKVDTAGNTQISSPAGETILLNAGSDIGFGGGGGAGIDWYVVGSDSSFQCQNNGCVIRLLSPDGTSYACSVANGGAFSCT